MDFSGYNNDQINAVINNSKTLSELRKDDIEIIKGKIVSWENDGGDFDGKTFGIDFEKKIKKQQAYKDLKKNIGDFFTKVSDASQKKLISVISAFINKEFKKSQVFQIVNSLSDFNAFDSIHVISMLNSLKSKTRASAEINTQFVNTVMAIDICSRICKNNVVEILDTFLFDKNKYAFPDGEGDFIKKVQKAFFDHISKHWLDEKTISEIKWEKHNNKESGFVFFPDTEGKDETFVAKIALSDLMEELISSGGSSIPDLKLMTDGEDIVISNPNYKTSQSGCISFSVKAESISRPFVMLKTKKNDAFPEDERIDVVDEVKATVKKENNKLLKRSWLYCLSPDQYVTLKHVVQEEMLDIFFKFMIFTNPTKNNDNIGSFYIRN